MSDQTTRRPVFLAVCVWLLAVAAWLPSAVWRRARRTEEGVEMIQALVISLFGILVAVFAFPLLKTLAQAVVDKITDLVNNAG